MPLSLVNCDRDPNILGRVVKTLGRRSTIPDLYHLDQSCERLREADAKALKTLAKPLEKLLGIRVATREELDAIVADGGWSRLLDMCAPVAARLKPGTQKEAHFKAVQNFVREITSRTREVQQGQEHSQGDSLDAAQREAIRTIRSGESVLLTGPPGSGKTHCALFALDVFALRHDTRVVLYVVPTAELALQAFANLCETFPALSVGIATLTMSHIGPRPNMIVGTPQEMWSYLSQSSHDWDTIILDEIHTIANTELGYSDALQYIAGGSAVTQIIALSATIHPTDVELLRNFFPVSNMRHVSLPPSPVPLKTYVLDPEKGPRPLGPGETSCPPVAITPQLLFLAMRRVGFDGTLVFAETDVATWGIFTSLLAFLETQNDHYYRRLWERRAELNALIQAAREHKEEIERLENVLEKRGGKVEAATGSLCTQMNQKREKVIGELTDILRKELKEPLKEAYMEKVCTDEESRRTELPVGSKISLCAKMVLQLLRSGDLPDLIPDIGPFFRLTQRTVHNEEFSAFLHMQFDAKTRKIKLDSSKQTAWTAVSNLVRFCEAESLEPMQVKPLIKMTVKALQYGIALMMPSLPFVVTQTIRRYLNERAIPFVFSTQEMAMGINCAIRNVFVLRVEGDIPASLRVQMAGRAGRRGFDTDGRIIYANIADLSDAVEHIAIPEPMYPVGTEESVCCCLADAMTVIADPKILAVLRKVRRDIPEERIAAYTRITELLRKDPRLQQGDQMILGDLNAALLACYQLHLHLKGIPAQEETVRRMASMLRTVVRAVTQACFRS